MKMRDLLMAVPADIGENPITGFGHTLLPRNIAEGADKCGEFSRRSLFRKIVEGDVLSLGDHQYMCRRACGNVVKGEHVLVLVDFLARDFAAKDASEDIVAIVGHHSSGQRFTRERFSSIPDMPSRRASSAATSAGDIPAAAHSTSR